MVFGRVAVVTSAKAATACGIVAFDFHVRVAEVDLHDVALGVFDEHLELLNVAGHGLAQLHARFLDGVAELAHIYVLSGAVNESHDAEFGVKRGRCRKLDSRNI